MRTGLYCKRCERYTLHVRAFHGLHNFLVGLAFNSFLFMATPIIIILAPAAVLQELGQEMANIIGFMVGTGFLLSMGGYVLMVVGLLQWAFLDNYICGTCGGSLHAVHASVPNPAQDATLAPLVQPVSYPPSLPTATAPPLSQNLTDWFLDFLVKAETPFRWIAYHPKQILVGVAICALASALVALAIVWVPTLLGIRP
jgi:hypothetical protein